MRHKCRVYRNRNYPVWYYKCYDCGGMGSNWHWEHIIKIALAHPKKMWFQTRVGHE